MQSPRILLLTLASALLLAGRLSAQETPDKLTIATWNLEWFFDEQTGDNYHDIAKQNSAPGREQWQWKRDTVAAAIAKMRPDILALQEIENHQVLYYLVQRLRANHNLRYRIGFVQGGDFFTEQDVAVLYRQDLVELGRWETTREEYDDKQLYRVNKHLFAKFHWGPGPERETLLLVNVHLRAQAEQAPLRRRQARQLNLWLNRLPPEQRRQLILLGDFNTTHDYGKPSDPPSELDILIGSATSDPADNLLDLHKLLPAEGRSTHLSGRQFDRILVAPGLREDGPGRDLSLAGVRVAKELSVRGQADKSHWEPQPYWSIPRQERDISDHYPVIATFRYK